MKKAWIVFWGWLLLVAAGASPLWSQQSDAAADREMVRALKKDYCSLGFLVQSVADFQSERTLPGRTGFSIANLRVLVSGRLQGGFGYFIQTSMIKSPAILDAKVYYEFSPAFALDFGQLKAPFSAEFLIFAGNIDFVNRAQAVSALAPGRQIGLQGRGWLSDRKVSYAVGVFNGNGIGANGNDNDEFLYAGRIAFYPGALIGLSSAGALEISLNAAASKDEKITIGGDVLAVGEGRRRLFGLDFRLSSRGWLLSGEFIHGQIDYAAGAVEKPSGYNGTLGYMVREKTQILVRWDAFNAVHGRKESEFLILGYNFWPTGLTELQLNYIVPAEDKEFAHHQVLLNAQVSF